MKSSWLPLLPVLALVGCAGNTSNSSNGSPYGADGRFSAERDARVREATKKLESGAGAKVAEAGAGFGFRLLSSLYKAKPGENLFISPISVQIALTMTLNGAAKDTYKVMTTTLGYGKLKMDEVNEGARQLSTVLTGADPQVTTTLANSLWVNDLKELKPEFIKRNTDSFQASVEAADLNSPAGVDAINDWVKTNTQNKIPKLFETLPPNVVTVLVNAIHFKGNWKEPFSPDMTRNRPFTDSAGKVSDVPMMSRSGLTTYGDFSLAYQDFSGFKGISLPYGRGRVAMDIWMPNKTADLPKFLTKFSAKNYSDWVAQMTPTELTDLALPKFKSESNLSLNDALKTLGMEIAFDSTKADFSEMRTGGGLWIGLVQHRTFIQVDEKGTEAAASTGVAAIEKAMPQPKSFVCDRPFVYVIRDTEAKSILFAGIMAKP